MSINSMRLSALRDIGWDHWDPIGLNGAEGGWRRSDAANEYDRYMQHIVDGLQRGALDETLIDYLVAIETRHMGLAETHTTRTRAADVVAIIREHLESSV